MFKRLAIAALALAAATVPAFAHFDPIAHGSSFFAGIIHPLTGLDHVLAMMAVGLWAASLVSRRAMAGIPAAFIGTMAIGFALAIAGTPLPLVEPVVLASVIFLGILVALALPVPAAGVALVVAFFALFHGFAHGTELAGATAWQFAAGFMVSTAVLHGAGIGLGLVLGRLHAPGALRLAGAATALGGAWLALAG